MGILFEQLGISMGGRHRSCKFEEGTTSQILVLLSAIMGLIYHLLVDICAN